MTKHTKIFANETEYKNYISSSAYQIPVISVMNDKRHMGYDNRKEEIIATTESNSQLITIAHQKGWIPSTQTYLTKHECEAVTSIDLSSSNIQIFDEFRYFTGITTIEENAFEYCDLISITLPNTITEIKFDGFYSCYNLTNIILPNSLKIIGDSAFEDCQSLQSIIIPNSVTTIGYQAFLNCGLTYIEIPETVKILNNCFTHCTNLTSVKLHEGLQYLSCFSSCTSLVSVDIPSTVITLGGFDNCSSLSEITFNGNSLISISNNCFNGCTSLHNLQLPDSVKTIGDSCFKNSGVKNIKIPEGVTTLSEYLFQNDEQLTSIKIPDSVDTIESYTFSNIHTQQQNNYSYNPLKITIPPNVAYIGDYCFSGLIDEIHFAGVIPPTITANTFSNINFSNTKITVSSSDYKTTTYWSSILTYYDYFHYY